MKRIVAIFLLIMISLTIPVKRPAAGTGRVITGRTYSRPLTAAFGWPVVLDADGNGTGDFLLTTVYETEDGRILRKFIIQPVGENEVLAVEDAAALANRNELLRSFGNIAWSNEPALLLERTEGFNNYAFNGLWSGDRDQYLGVRIRKEGETFTGWIKLRMDVAVRRMLVDGYAINMVPGGVVRAGEGLTTL